MRRTKIVCTLGPAISSVEMMEQLILSGMNVARLNFSHGTHEEHLARVKMLREAAGRLGREIPIMLDNKGPEIRIGLFENGKTVLSEGGRFTLTTRPVMGNDTMVAVEYVALPHEVQVGGLILLDDGTITLRVESVHGEDVVCAVVNGGELSNRKKVNLPGAIVSLPAVSQKDVDDIRFGADQGFDFVAASFIRKASDVLEIRKVIEDAGSDMQIIAKIENQEGVDNLDEILKVVDGLMVARGDLGVEIPAEEVPIVQKEMIQKCQRLGIPVITATQMLDSMIRNPRPTRAEASDIANAIFDGTDAIMLSGETASGKFPIEAVRTMARIAERAEKALVYQEPTARRMRRAEHTITDAISHAVCQTALDLGASAIVSATQSGHTARMMAKYRPQAPVIAVTPSVRVARKLALSWGVYPVLGGETSSTDEMIKNALGATLGAGYIRSGDLVVLTAGVPVGVPGTTNMLQVHTVGDIAVRGVGIGTGSFTGRAVIAHTAREASQKLNGPNQVLVTIGVDAEYVPALGSAAALITEEAGLTSPGAIIGLNLGIPVIVGAEGATSLITDETEITLDLNRGLVYRGQARVL
ncbi:MAG: pyruvate kinase [Bacillota bacterium]